MSYQADTLIIHEKEGYVIVEMNNGKVNALNLAILKDLRDTFNALNDDENIKGAIWTGRPHGFSAGLDVMSLASMDHEAHLDFWVSYMGAMQAMVGFKKPLVTAITGWAPAGATILPICTDYRIMGKGARHVMGMHEFKMSMQIPELLCKVYAYQLGEVRAWKAIQNHQLFNSDEALAIGLVDESVEVDEVLPRAEQFLQQQMKVHPKVYWETKRHIRKGLIDLVMNADLKILSEEFVAFNNDPELQAKTIEFMMALKSK